MQRALRLRQHLQRGQAMLEYSTLSFAILIGLAAAGFGLPLAGNMSLVEQVYASLQTYLLNIFYALALSPV